MQQEMVGINLEPLLEVLDGLIIPSRKVKAAGNADPGDWGKRINFFGLLNDFNRLVCPAHRCEIFGIPVISDCMSRVKFKRAFEFLIESGPIPLMQSDMSE